LGRKDPAKQATEPRVAVDEGVYSHLYVAMLQSVLFNAVYSLHEIPRLMLVSLHSLSSPFSLPDYIPPTKPYEMSQVVADLLMFAVKNLVRGGRLVYWLPTVTEDYSIDDLPTHPCMELISNCEQAFGQWSRRLITMEKVKDWDGEAALGPPTGDMNKSTTAPIRQGHFGFRDRYFAFSIVENAKRKKELKEAFHQGGVEAVAACVKQQEAEKKQKQRQQQQLQQEQDQQASEAKNLE